MIVHGSAVKVSIEFRVKVMEFYASYQLYLLRSWNSGPSALRSPESEDQAMSMNGQ